jgi:hypothetical protein
VDPELTLSGVEVSDISKCGVYSFGVLFCNLISNQLSLDNGRPAKVDMGHEHVPNRGRYARPDDAPGALRSLIT